MGQSKNISEGTSSSQSPDSSDFISDDLLDFQTSFESISEPDGEDDAPLSAQVYQDRYVAFLDILGFKDFIARSARGDDRISPSLIYAALNIRHASVINNFLSLTGIQDPEEYDFLVHSFSDCVVASCKKTPQGLALLTFFCWSASSDWLSKKFLSRGGIASGKLVHQVDGTDGHILFGPAFIAAYKIESEISDFPRIIFSKEVRQDWNAIYDSCEDGWVEKTVSLTTAFDDGPAGIDLFAHLHDNALASGNQSFKKDVGQFQQALLIHAEETCDSPYFFRKVKWLIERFNEAVGKSNFSDDFQIRIGNF